MLFNLILKTKILPNETHIFFCLTSIRQLKLFFHTKNKMNLKHNTQKFIETDLFFIQSKNVVGLKPVGGGFRFYHPSDIYRCSSIKATNDSLLYKRPFSNLGKDYEGLLIVAVPSEYLYINIDYEQNLEFIKYTEIFSNPLIKTDLSDNESIVTAYMSGMRSCIIKVNTKFFRAKGCGMLNYGIVLAENQIPKNTKTIKGCQFENTCLRELYISSKIEQILKPFGFVCGNYPYGFWRYDFTSNEKTKNDAPLIPKYCSLYQTRGEKRVSSHVFQGFYEIIYRMLKLYDTPEQNQSTNENTMLEGKFAWNNEALDKIKKLFPADRLVKNELISTSELTCFNDFENITKTSAEYIATRDIFWNNELLLNIEDKEVFNNLINILQPLLKQESLENVLQSIQMENPNFGDFLEQLAKKIITYSSAKVFELMIKLFYNFGHEMGLIKRIFYDNDINWGHYIDHYPEPHCNAHPNNFVVTNEEFGDRFLAPLDFDMAFEKNEFISILEDNTFGKKDLKQFDMLTYAETFLLESTIAGAEMITNFKLVTKKFDFLQEDLKKMFNTITLIFNDICLKGYRHGFYKKSVIEEFRIKKDESSLNLIKIALVLTDEVIA